MYRIEYYITFENERKVLVGQIQVKGLLCWHKVTEVQDEDADYVMNRAQEIVEILENPHSIMNRHHFCKTYFPTKKDRQ